MPYSYKQQHRMNTDKHLHFIANKISEINVALFHCHVNSVLTIPTSIINTHKVDEVGNILFFMPRPKQMISEFEKEFPVGLNYFKKGVSHFVNVFGKARIINDPEELNGYDLSSEEINRALTTEMLIQVKILKADYFENDKKENTWFSKVKSFVYGLLAWADREERSYHFGSEPTVHHFGF